MEQLGSHWMDFSEIQYFNISLKSVEKIQILLKPDKNKGYMTRRTIYVLSYLAHLFVEPETSQAKVVEKIGIYIL